MFCVTKSVTLPLGAAFLTKQRPLLILLKLSTATEGVLRVIAQGGITTPRLPLLIESLIATPISRPFLESLAARAKAIKLPGSQAVGVALKHPYLLFIPV